MALVELRKILLLLLIYINIFCTSGLTDVIVNDISIEKSLTETKEEIGVNCDSSWYSWQDYLVLAWLPVLWLFKIIYNSFKLLLLLCILGELYQLLNQINKILQYVVIMVGLSVLVYYYTSWIVWVLEIMNTIFNIWTVFAFTVCCFVFLLELIYTGVIEIISQSLIMGFFLMPILLFLEMVEIVLEDDDEEEEVAPAA